MSVAAKPWIRAGAAHRRLWHTPGVAHLKARPVGRNAHITRESPGAETQTRLYAGRYRPIPVHLPPEVAAHMPLFIADWPHEAGAGPAGVPTITLAPAAAGYRLTIFLNGSPMPLVKGP